MWFVKSLADTSSNAKWQLASLDAAADSATALANEGDGKVSATALSTVEKIDSEKRWRRIICL